jgi:hypothetical protein
MTGTQEVVEDQLFELQKQKTSNQKEYYQDLIKIDRLMQNGVKLSKENLADMKDFYSHDSLGYKSKAIEISPRAAGRAVAPSKSLGIATPGIQKYGGTTLEQIQAIVEENKFQATLEGVRGMVSSLENTFAGMFMTISSGSDRAFQDMAKAFGRSLQQMAAQMAAKAAIFGILNILSGGTGGIAQIATGLLGGQNLGSFLGFGGGMKGTNRVQVGVTGTISGSNINLSNSRFGNELTRNS